MDEGEEVLEEDEDDDYDDDEDDSDDGGEGDLEIVKYFLIKCYGEFK